MAKQLNVDLRFNADTSQAKKAIQDLQNTLNNLSSLGTAASTTGFNQQIASATVEANKLKVALTDAFNTKTGAIDLSKLQANLRQAGSSIEQVSNSLINMGPVGQRAFQQFAATIAQAQVPTMRLNGLLGEMWTTLKNVARFQISSSIIHGLIGGVQSAFSYAQNLNQSLNNIRIVTGDNVEKMAQFAREANNAAKALSSTTLDYTNASLIYYQQGLNDQAVKARTDVTVKLANVTRQSAEEVSNQMTAIWNNFDDGSKSMEYFADVITALGATTASSSAEIATGLQKFAPIAGTIGLSYEKATAALATIVATTRQSAETVGTGLRTIFSRFESLKLGETLEDGVDLNKYTKALQTIGVNVLDANGKLREMDDILDDIGANWQKLDNTQRTAFATTVGGVRQYTNLIALFDNWDAMQRNLATATGSEGTLQGQADIYAESWEAARDRVKTALQGLYDSLINDDFFIDLLNGIEKLITGVDRFVQSIGGAKGVILGVAAAILSFANAGVSNAISNMTYNIMSLTGAGQKRTDEMRDSVANKALNLQISGSPVEQARSQALKDQVSLQNTLNQYGRDYNSIQRSIAQSLIEQHKQHSENLITAEEELRNARNILTARNMEVNTISHGTFTSAQAVVTAYEAQTVSIEEFARANGLTTTLVRECIAAVQEEANVADRAATAHRTNAESLNTTNEALKNLKTTTMTGSDIMAGFASGITSAVFAGNMLISTIKTIGDETASTGQKITSLITTLSMATPMLLKGAGQFKNSWQGWSNNISSAVTMGEFQNTNSLINALGPMTQQEVALGGSSADMIKSVAYEARITEKQAEIVVNEALAKSNGQLTAEELKEALAKAGVDTAGKKNIITKTAEKLVIKLLGKEAATTNAIMLASLGIYAAIAVAIAAVVAAIYLAIKAYNADAEAAKKAAESAKELREQSEAVAQKAKEIKEIFGTYDTAVEALKKCTKGTKEWYDALENVNNIVLNILEKYPELANELVIDRSNGYADIRNAEQIIEKADKLAEYARAAALEGAINASEAQLKSDSTNVYRQFKEAGNNNGPNSYSNRQGSLNNNIRRQIIDNALEYSGLSLEEFSEKIKAAGLEISDFETQKFQQAINSLGDSTQALANQINNTTALLMDQQLGDKYDISTKGLTGEIYNNRINQIEAEIKEIDSGITRWASANNDQVDKLWKRYQQAAGISYSLSTNAVRGGGNSRTYQYIGADGKAQDVSINTIATTIAAAEALKELTGNANTAANLLHNLPDNVRESVTSYFANNGFEDISVGIFQNYAEKLFDAEGNILKDIDQQKIVEEFFGGSDNFVELIRAQVGSDIVEGSTEWNKASAKLVDDWIAAATRYNNSIQALGDNLSSTVKTAFEDFKNENWFTQNSLSTQDQIVQMLQTIFAFDGETGLQAAIEQLKSLDSEEIKEFFKLIDETDWNTSDLSDFNDKLEDAGIELDTLDGPFSTFIQHLRQTKQELIGIKEATESYSTITGAKDKLLSGKSITQDEYDKATAAGFENLGNYVTMDKAGNYWLTASASEFVTAADNAANQLHNAIVSGGAEAAALLAAAMGNGQATPEDMSNNAITGRRRTNKTNSEGKMTYDLIGNTDQLELQLQVLEALGEETDNWRTSLREKTFTVEQGQEVADAFSIATGGARTYAEAIEYLNGLGEKSTLAAAMSAQSTEELGQTLANGETNLEGYHKGLIKLGNSYEGCNDEVQELNEVLKDNSEDSDKAREASRKLWDAVRKAEWKKVSKEAKTYIDILEDAESTPTDLQEAYDGLAKTLNKTFNTKVTGKWVEENKKLFHEWATASEENANDVAEAILRLSKIDQPELFENENGEQQVKFTIDTTEFTLAADKYEQLKTLLADPATVEVDMYGNANLSNLFTQLQNLTGDSGTAAAMLAALGQTEVTLGINADELQHFNLTTQEGIKAFLDALGNWNGSLTADGQVPVFGTGATDADAYMKPAGGGGGGSKRKKKEAPKPDRGARYHEVDKQADVNKRRQQAAADLADRTVGRTKEKQLERQIKLEEKSLELSKRKLKEAQEYLKVDEEAMQNALNKLGLEAQFDQEGLIDNYEEIYEELYQKEKALVEKYNSGAISEEKYEQEKEKIDEAKEAMGDYEETIEAAQEAAEAMVDSINKMLDLQLEKITYDIEFQIQLNDADVKLLEHLYDKLDDNVYATAQSIALLNKEQQILLDDAAKYQEEYNKLREEMYAEAEKWRNKAANDTELQALLFNYGLSYEDWQNLSPDEIINYLNGTGYTEAMQELADKMLDLDSQMDEVAKKITDKFISALDELYDKSKDQIDIFNKLTDVLSSYSDIIDLTRGSVGAAAANAAIADLRNRKITIGTTKTGESYKLYQQMVSQRKAIEQEMQNATEAEKERWTEVYEHALEKEREAQQAALDDATDTLEQIKENAEAIIEQMGEDYKNAFTKNVGDNDWFNTVYDRQKKLEDSWLQDYEKLYRLSELENQSNKLLDNLVDPKYRKMVLDFQDKVNAQKKAGVKVSQSQVEAEQKWLDLIQARIDLEDAYKAKSQVRLQRDNEGNWGYVYSADPDAVEDANAKVQKALYEYQNSLYQSNQEILEEVKDFQAQLADEMTTLNQKLLDGLITEDEYNREVERLENLAKEQLTIYSNLFNEFAELFGDTYAETLELYGVEDASINGEFGNTLLGRLLGVDLFNSDTIIKDMLDGLANLADAGKTAWENMKGQQDELSNMFGFKNVPDYLESIPELTETVIQAVEENVKAVDKLDEAFSETMLDSLQAVKDSWAEWLEQLGETQENMLDLVKLINDWNRGVYYAGDETGNNPIDVPSWEDLQENIEMPDLYTEALPTLMSNEAVDNLESILSMLSLQAQTAMNGFGAMVSPYYSDTSGDTLQQEVHIDANFPNVTNSNEIQEAFENLVNKAAQFAHRKRQG